MSVDLAANTPVGYTIPWIIMKLTEIHLYAGKAKPVFFGFLVFLGFLVKPWLNLGLTKV